MKTKEEIIKRRIIIDPANFEYCLKHRIINGNLLQGIKDAMETYAQQFTDKAELKGAWTDNDIDAAFLMGLINSSIYTMPEFECKSSFPSLEMIQKELQRLKSLGYASPHNAVRAIRYPANVCTTKDLEAKSKIKIVCICGSGRFLKEMHEVEERLTLEGVIVLMIGVNTKDVARTEDLSKYKPMLDELHLRKIDLSDDIFVVNKDGYIGESTRKEIDYAIQHGKQIQYLEPTKDLDDSERKL